MARGRDDEPTKLQRICVLSGGGDAPGVNAIIRALGHAARGLSLELFGCHYGFEGLFAPNGIRPLALEELRGILPKGGSVLGCSTRINPFYFVAGDGGKPCDMGPEVVARLRALGIDALNLIGGDGTMVAGERFSALGMPCIGVPKTIDNDLEGTELTCGFQSAVETATHAVDALHSTAEAHARVMLVEVMGRYAGWIALSAGLAGGADVILLPEIPYRLHRIVAKIREREALGLRFSIVVVAEGARPVGGDVLAVTAARPGHLPRLGGAGARLLQELEAADTGHEIRLTVLGHLQRGGTPLSSDRLLGSQIGAYAAELCHRREYGRRIVVRGGKLLSIPFGPCVEQALHRRLEPNDPLAHAARLVGIELGDAPAPTAPRSLELGGAR
jgi:6-phosphofructokinase 1